MYVETATWTAKQMYVETATWTAKQMYVETAAWTAKQMYVETATWTAKQMYVESKCCYKNSIRVVRPCYTDDMHPTIQSIPKGSGKHIHAI